MPIFALTTQLKNCIFDVSYTKVNLLPFFCIVEVGIKHQECMKTEQKRVCIYPKDVQRITGKSYRSSRLLILDVKKHFNKEEHQLVSIEEFCLYTGLKSEEVIPFIVG